MPLMHAYHSKISVSGAQHYFSNLNPIAEKIAQDMRDTQTTYGQLWNTLTTSEQDDIINETLIKPEIAIKYYENISTLCSSNSTLTVRSPNPESSDCLFGVSTDSLSTLLIRNQNVAMLPTNLNSVESQYFNQMKFSPQSYLYDQRNLLTYTQQTIASKIVHDDAGIFRDEHSAPFSYRTRSQINLSIFVDFQKNIIKTDKNMIKDNKSNFQKLQIEHKQAKHIHEISHKINLKFSCNNIIKSSDINEDGFNKEDMKSRCDKKSIIDAAPKNSNLKANPNPLSVAQIMPKLPCISYCLNSTNNYSEDKLNLMQHFSSRSVVAASSSSAGTTDDEDEDKTLCTEKVKLLESDCDIRKGFDFLNNW